MLWCQGAQNIGLSSHKLKSTLKRTVWSQCTPVPRRQKSRAKHHKPQELLSKSDKFFRDESCIDDQVEIKESLTSETAVHRSTSRYADIKSDFQGLPSLYRADVACALWK